MIDLLAIDRWSATGNGWLHRLPPAAKLTAVALGVVFLVAIRDARPLAGLYGVLLVVLASSGLPPFRVLGLSLLPVMMSGVFAISRASGGWDDAAAVVLKGAITSLTMLLLVCSTPHTTLLRLARRVLPGVLADMLFLGYRSIFTLLGRALQARDAVRLRGAPAPWHVRLRRGGLIGALSVLRATELATEQYAALRLRSPAGRYATSPIVVTNDTSVTGTASEASEAGAWMGQSSVAPAGARAGARAGACTAARVEARAGQPWWGQPR